MRRGTRRDLQPSRSSRSVCSAPRAGRSAACAPPDQPCRRSTLPTAATEPKAIARGRLVYQVHCARCHGASGHGDGSDAPLLKTPPRDLAAVVGTRSDDVLRRSITEGIAGTPMTGFGQLLSTRELDSLLEFVRSLATDFRPRPNHPTRCLPRWPKSWSARASSPMLVGGLLRALEVRDVDGKTTSLDSLRGSVVLVVFWGTSCSSCVNELPELEQLAEQYRRAGLESAAGLPRPDRGGRGSRGRQGHARNLSVYVDPDGFARLRYDVQGLPTAVLIDREGRMLGTAQGARNWADPEVHALITSCLAGS